MLEKPSLPGPAPLSIDRIILRNQLSSSDLRELFSVLNEKGEFDSLRPWMDQLSDAQVDGWTSFLNRWVYETAQTSGGLIQLLRTRFNQKGFQAWNTQLDKTLKDFPQLRDVFSILLSEKISYEVLKRDVVVLDPILLKEVLPQLIQDAKAYIPVNTHQKTSSEAVVQDLKSLLGEATSRNIISKIGTAALESQLFPSLMRASVDLKKKFGMKGLANLALQFSKHSEFRSNEEGTKTNTLADALELAQLLNRPAEKIVLALQQGLKTNPDTVQALSLKWDPVISSTVADLIAEVLIQPEDGQPLEKNFWLALPRKNAGDEPTPEFARLYALVFSGLQKITDPRRMETQGDSGSYRLPLQLNALFLSRWLENVALIYRPQIEKTSTEEFLKKLWSLPSTEKEYRYDLSEGSDKAILASSVKKDLAALGLTTVLSRLENLLSQTDFGRTDYTVEFSENINVRQAFSEVVSSANRIRPFSDITPFLVATIHHFIEPTSESVFGLESFKSIPNLLLECQSVLSALRPEQWKKLEKFLFQDIKISHLEPEDRALIVGLFQSDPEVADWMNQVLTKLSSIELLNQGETGQVTLFDVYQSILRNLNPEAKAAWGSVLAGLADLQLLQANQEGKARYPGMVSLLQSGDGIAALLNSFSGLSLAQQDYLSRIVFDALGPNLKNEFGFEVHLSWLSSFLNSVELKSAQVFFEWIGNLGWSTIPSGDIVTVPERMWVINFVSQGGLNSLQELIQKRPSSFSVQQLVNELIRLTNRKVWNQAFRLLGQIQDERMRVIARCLFDWDASGEFSSFLDSVSKVFSKGEKHD